MISCILLERGPGWQHDRQLEDQGLGPHRSYLQALARDGVVLAAGPFTSVDGGLILLSVTDRDEAERILRNDPAVANGVFNGEIRDWTPLIDPKGRLAERGRPTTETSQ